MSADQPHQDGPGYAEILQSWLFRDKQPRSESDYWLKRDGEEHIRHISRIGSGGYGEVHKASFLLLLFVLIKQMEDAKTHSVFARKIIRPFASMTEEEIATEISAVSSLCVEDAHANIVKVLKFGVLRSPHAFYFIDMEYCECNLHDYVTGVRLVHHELHWPIATQEDKMEYLTDSLCTDIVAGLIFIHSKDLVHRDISPQNVLYSAMDSKWKLADFGLTSTATTTKAVETPRARGKEGYRAPEMIGFSRPTFLGDAESTFNKKSDIWSFGCVLFELCVGRKAFAYDAAALDAARQGKPVDVRIADVAEPRNGQLCSLIGDALRFNPTDRPSALDIRETLERMRSDKSTKEPETSLPGANDEVVTMTDSLGNVDISGEDTASDDDDDESLYASADEGDDTADDLPIVYETTQFADTTVQRNKNPQSMLHLSETKLGLSQETQNIITQYDAGSTLDEGRKSSDRERSNNSPLHVAAYEGHKSVVELLLKHKVDPNIRNATGRTPLHGATQNGHMEIVDLLLDANADILVVDKNGVTVLDVAVRSGHRALVARLLERGADPNGSQMGTSTAQVAIFQRDTEALKMLLNAGADISFQEPEKHTTAIQLAAYLGLKDAVELLLERGANVNVSEKSGRTPMHDAAQEGHGDVVELLIDKGADPCAKDARNITVLYMAASNGHVHIVDLLLKNGADPEIASVTGRTALFQAAMGGYTEVVRRLLQEKCDPKHSDEEGDMPFNAAAYEGHKDIVELFLGCGIDPNIVSGKGRTALHGAAQNGHQDVVELLLQAGVNPSAEDRKGVTVLHVAAFGGHEGIVQQLVRARVDVNPKTLVPPIHVAAVQGHDGIVERLLQAGSDPNWVDDDGDGLLHVIVQCCKPQTVGVVLDHGADPNLKNKRGKAALHIAAARGDTAALEMLLAKGDQWIQDDVGNTALHVAAFAGHKTALDLLLRYIPVDMRDNTGRTAMHDATQQGHEDIVEALLEAGGNPMAEDENGITVMHVAAFNGRAAILETLLIRQMGTAKLEELPAEV